MKRTVHRAVVDAGIRGERRTNAAPSLARIRSSYRNDYYQQDTVPRALPGAPGTPPWIALMLIKRDVRGKHSVRLKQKKAGWDNDFLLHLLTRGVA